MPLPLLRGRPAEEIRDWVSSHGVDLTVLGSHGASGWTGGSASIVVGDPDTRPF